MTKYARFAKLIGDLMPPEIKQNPTRNLWRRRNAVASSDDGSSAKDVYPVCTPICLRDYVLITATFPQGVIEPVVHVVLKEYGRISRDGRTRKPTMRIKLIFFDGIVNARICLQKIGETIPSTAQHIRLTYLVRNFQLSFCATPGLQQDMFPIISSGVDTTSLLPLRGSCVHTRPSACPRRVTYWEEGAGYPWILLRQPDVASWRTSALSHLEVLREQWSFWWFAGRSKGCVSSSGIYPLMFWA